MPASAPPRCTRPRSPPPETPAWRESGPRAPGPRGDSRTSTVPPPSGASRTCSITATRSRSRSRPTRSRTWPVSRPSRARPCCWKSRSRRAWTVRSGWPRPSPPPGSSPNSPSSAALRRGDTPVPHRVGAAHAAPGRQRPAHLRCVPPRVARQPLARRDGRPPQPRPPPPRHPGGRPSAPSSRSRPAATRPAWIGLRIEHTGRRFSEASLTATADVTTPRADIEIFGSGGSAAVEAETAARPAPTPPCTASSPPRSPPARPPGWMPGTVCACSKSPKKPRRISSVPVVKCGVFCAAGGAERTTLMASAGWAGRGIQPDFRARARPPSSAARCSSTAASPAPIVLTDRWVAPASRQRPTCSTSLSGVAAPADPALHAERRRVAAGLAAAASTMARASSSSGPGLHLREPAVGRAGRPGGRPARRLGRRTRSGSAAAPAAGPGRRR